MNNSINSSEIDFIQNSEEINNCSENQLLLKALEYHKNGQINQAQHFYSFFVNKGYQHPTVFTNYGIILTDKSCYEEAISLFEKSLKLFPDVFETHLNLANCLRQIGLYSKAKDSAILAIKLNPDSSVAHNSLGLIFLDLNQFNEAESSFRKALTFNFSFSEAHNNLASVYLSLGKDKEAEAEVKLALKFNKNLAQAYYNLGLLFKNRDKFDDAATATAHAIKLKPDFLQAINFLGTIYFNLANFEEARKLLLKSIELSPKDPLVYNNLACIYISEGKLESAENVIRKSIKLNGSCAESYYNLGRILLEKSGDLKAAQCEILKALELNKNSTSSYFTLSTFPLKYFPDKLKSYLLSDKILLNASNQEKINIYFARSNLFHKQSNFNQSADNLIKANLLKSYQVKSDVDKIFKKSSNLFEDTQNINQINKVVYNKSNSIFIVGMPRSGSTLLESIISMNQQVRDLGETNILDKLYNKYKSLNDKNLLNHFEIDYLQSTQLENFSITTNKNLYNFQYIGIITKLLPSAKIIFCYRNPLDNILSIYRSCFTYGNHYSNSLEDISKVYVHHHELIKQYKEDLSLNIYDLNYDELVIDPKNTIKSLISWLGWGWSSSYLVPNTNNRSIRTASCVQARMPINSNSLGGWHSYRDMLSPAIEFIKTSSISHLLT